MNPNLSELNLNFTPGAAQKGQDFIEAFMMGFEIQDAVALLRLDDLYIDSFIVTDVKMLSGDHLSRAIGRIAGQGNDTNWTLTKFNQTKPLVNHPHKLYKP